eukprot:TRINITY_DN17420_c0_g1_i1.p1 TRINITY_DN17420_c0_g1~~TRINITY_DN17420_c0_g1_i1.p1  ORF type:complete len:169 (-),score=9.43 TRINITY_DN17420_c0_g1_i1:54-497(-)
MCIRDSPNSIKGERYTFSINKMQNHTYDKCPNCSKKIEMTVELSCEHAVCKTCLIKYAIESFLKYKQYRHCGPCSLCNRTKKIERLTLDCGCACIKFGKEMEFVSKYSNISYGRDRHVFTFVDLCLLIDNVSFRYTCLLYTSPSPRD